MNFLYHICIALSISAVILMLLFLNHSVFAISTPNTSQFEIIRAIPFNNTILSSLTLDPTSDLVYVSGMPDYSFNASSIPCLEHNTNSSDMPCSVIYVLDGGTGQIHDIIRLKSGEIIHDMDINPQLGKIYAAGEYNYIDNNTESIQYEDDVVYIINQTSSSANNITNDNLSQTITSNDIQRIRLYGEEEEGKEGGMSSIAVDTRSDTIYAGIRYFQGGREGIFTIGGIMSYFGWDGIDDFDTARVLFAALGELKRANIDEDLLIDLNDSGYTFEEIADYLDGVR